MATFRRAIAPIAALWLVCQAATLAGVTTFYWDTSVEALLECTCGHGDHAICPMHHRPVRTRCGLLPTHDVDTGPLASLLNLPTPVPAVSELLGAAPASPASIIATAAPPSLRPAPPDPPPPRI